MKKLTSIFILIALVFTWIGVAGEQPATPTDLHNTIQVTKILKGEIWQVRCDVMDNTTYQAGGGYWYPDITNHEHLTSKEGHRSNHCGDWENWVLFVDDNGVATGLYQLKSGSTGGTLPSIMYRAPSRLANVPESQLIYDPTDPYDEMNAYLLEHVFIPSNVMPFRDIPLQEGQRLFWISQNGKQVWHHTGVLRKTHPRFAIVINGTPYTLGVGDTIQIDDVEEGLLQVEEIATANYKLETVTKAPDGNYSIINIVDDPGRPSPTPPPAITPSPTPTDFTPTASPSPTPTPVIDIQGQKIWDDNKDADGIRPDSIIVILLVDNNEIDRQMVTANKEGKWYYAFTGLPEYNDEGEIIGYTISEEAVEGYTMEHLGKNLVNVHPTFTPSPTSTPTPTPTPTATPTPTLTPSPTPTITPQPTFTPTPTPTVSPTPSPKSTDTPMPTSTPTPTPTPTPKPTIPGKQPKRPREIITIEGYDTPLGVDIYINHVGDCFD